MAITVQEVKVLIHLEDGSDQGYFREYDDPTRGAVHNVETLSQWGTLVAGGWTRQNKTFFDLPKSVLEQAQAWGVLLDDIASASGLDFCEHVVKVFRKVGVNTGEVWYEARAWLHGKGFYQHMLIEIKP